MRISADDPLEVCGHEFKERLVGATVFPSSHIWVLRCECEVQGISFYHFSGQ